MVLHADDLADPAPFRDLRGCDVAEPDVAHQTLPLKLGQDRERRLDRSFGGPVDIPHDPQVDDLQRIEPEIAEIVVDRALKLGGRHGGDPGCVDASAGADLGDDHETVGIGMQRLADDLIGDVGPIEIAGVDVIDPLATASRSTAIAPSRSFGGPNTPGPASCMAP